jgi:hypothetical protein
MCHNAHADAWQELPPLAASIEEMVAVDGNCAERLARSIAADRPVSIIHNAVDLQRFQRRAPLAKIPRRAAVFGNRVKPGPQLGATVTAGAVVIRAAGRRVSGNFAIPHRHLLRRLAERDPKP